ncbi:hypothetical protein BSFA1_78400 (plasmid) [Burkholderia sp. SFA1]|nr:hypothetical protein BSFA1_78400 [Burkholderia sp. SFA1]
MHQANVLASIGIAIRHIRAHTRLLLRDGAYYLDADTVIARGIVKTIGMRMERGG